MVASPPLLDLEPARRDAAVGEWLAQTFRTYPAQTARLLEARKDRFQNPVGYALRVSLPALLDELTGGFDRARVRAALDEVVRIRAVQDFDAEEAIGFVFLLKPILREQLDPPGGLGEALERRVEELAALAAELYDDCRKRMIEIQRREAERRVYVARRIASRGTRH